jgi:hypothetical protein
MPWILHISNSSKVSLMIQKNAMSWSLSAGVFILSLISYFVNVYEKKNAQKQQLSITISYIFHFFYSG